MGKTKRATKEIDDKDELILSSLADGGYITISQLSKVTNMTKQAVEKRVYDLNKMGKIKEKIIGNKKHIRSVSSNVAVISEMNRILSRINKEKKVSKTRLKEILRGMKTQTVSGRFGTIYLGGEMEEQINLMLPSCLNCDYSLNNEGKEYLKKWKKN